MATDKWKTGYIMVWQKKTGLSPASFTYYVMLGSSEHSFPYLKHRDINNTFLTGWGWDPNEMRNMKTRCKRMYIWSFWYSSVLAPPTSSPLPTTSTRSWSGSFMARPYCQSCILFGIMFLKETGIQAPEINYCSYVGPYLCNHAVRRTYKYWTSAHSASGDFGLASLFIATNSRWLPTPCSSDGASPLPWTQTSPVRFVCEN